jgi:hypothetical protein
LRSCDYIRKNAISQYAFIRQIHDFESCCQDNTPNTHFHGFRFHAEINAIRRADVDTFLALGTFSAVQAAISLPSCHFFTQGKFIRFKIPDPFIWWKLWHGDWSNWFPILGAIEDIFLVYDLQLIAKRDI